MTTTTALSSVSSVDVAFYRRSTCVDGCVDADVRLLDADGEMIAEGEITVAQADGSWSSYGSYPDQWISGDLLRRMRELDKDGFRALCERIEDAVSARKCFAALRVEFAGVWYESAAEVGRWYDDASDDEIRSAASVLLGRETDDDDITEMRDLVGSELTDAFPELGE